MRLICACALASALVLGCSSTTSRGGGGATPAVVVLDSQRSSSTKETPAPAESNPAGDIPDNQVFVRYVSPAGGFEVETAEGWSRSTSGATVTFTDKYNGERVWLSRVAESVSQRALRAEIERSTAAIRWDRVMSFALPAGEALRFTFTSNSQPDEVTGKKIRLQNEAYVFRRRTGSPLATAHPTAILMLWAPLGSDNADQWNRIAHSFRWR